MTSGSRLMAAAGVALCLSFVAVQTADAARRGGGFGSRGARTYQAPPPTRTAPERAPPIERSMTARQPQPGASRPAPSPNAAAKAPTRGGFGGFGGGLLGGLLAGGLIGALMGNGFGSGFAGVAALLFQLALAAGVTFLLVRLFRRRQPALAGPTGWPTYAPVRGEPFARTYGGQAAEAGRMPPAGAGGLEILIDDRDRSAFEQLLMEVQDAFGREDYAALRERTTPEIMGFLAEDLAQNATAGMRNEIFGTRLLEADVAEAWREGDREFATAALRYEAVDVFRDRVNGQVVQGDPSQPSQTTELWTFVRERRGPWKVSAIQPAALSFGLS